MRHRLTLLLILWCGNVAAQMLTDRVSLTIVLKKQNVPAPVLNAMRRETETAVQPAGMQLAWRSHDHVGEISGSIAIIQLRGDCSPRAPIRTVFSQQRIGEPLGQTHVVDGKVLPFADILCDAVRRIVDRDLRVVPVGQRDQVLGRALGRVLAHELYHIVLHTTDHSAHGLARPEQSSRELLAPVSAFTEDDDRRLAGSAAAGR
jgi:hypothetical protein